MALVISIVATAGMFTEGDPLSALARAVSSVPVVAGASLLLVGIASAIYLVAQRRLLWLIVGIPCSAVLLLVVLVVIGLALGPGLDGLILPAMFAPIVILLGGTLTVLMSLGLLLPGRARTPVTVVGVVFIGASVVCGFFALQS
ncbi:hypothetical protein GCM10011512_21140 [Tersicoccus solisilvae]|uniref:Uncharacterized protein n=1 Tax=Tersicoccus solisilvae TaxID=1882339 RepID=A0ABQ1P9M4_9MICC|nr:hypothetical protein [Tersicoccus solisilvae]GGC93884.1 hypothetical protein GCM10011512_21140 [Tersicoccus solisilvae]